MNKYRCWIIWIAGMLALAVHERAANAASTEEAIGNAIAAWTEQVAEWHQRRLYTLDERERIAAARPIAEALAKATGKAAILSLRARFRQAPELILLTLDKLGASETLAKEAVELFKDPRPHSSSGKRFEGRHVLVWVSLCSQESRRATATVLVKQSGLMVLLFDEGKGIIASDLIDPVSVGFVEVVGDQDAIHALEIAAKETSRRNLREVCLNLSATIRRREAIPAAQRESQTADELLYWQALTDLLPYHARSMAYEKSAETVVAQHQRISTDFLLEKVHDILAKHAYPGKRENSYGPDYETLNLIVYILGAQRDPAGLEPLVQIAKKFPELGEEVKYVLRKKIATKEAKRKAEEIGGSK